MADQVSDQMGLWLTDEAVDRAGRNAEPDWVAEAFDAVYVVALRLALFTTDDVWEALRDVEATTHEPRAIGAVMRTAAREGLCVTTSGYLTSSRRACHRRPLRVWKSLIYR